jgi:hypothetical protein
VPHCWEELNEVLLCSDLHAVQRRSLRRINALKRRTLAVMHGSSFHGGGAGAIQSPAKFIKKTLGE